MAPELELPAPARLCLLSFKSPTSVQAEPFHFSATATAVVPGFPPPKTIASDVVPLAEATKLCLGVFISVVSVQEAPFHDSTLASGLGTPEQAKAAVLVPKQPYCLRAELKSATSVHEELSHSSVFADRVGSLPPAIIAAVLVPACP